VLSVIRKQALSKTGIPLGLLGAGFYFDQLSFLWSPSYCLGGLGVNHPARRLLIMSVIAICGLLAVFAGPASALLMIPALHSKWPAGGTGFYAVGTDDTLWPDRLNASHVGGHMCRRPSLENLTIAPLIMAGCIWHGQSELAENLKDRHFDWQANITINDGVVKRQITRHLYRLNAPGPESWALGVHVTAARLSRVIADEWSLATHNASSAQGLGRYVNIKNAANAAGITSVRSWLPAVRTACSRVGDIGNIVGNYTTAVSYLDISRNHILNHTSFPYYHLTKL
jgi:hypothetical protein